MAAGGSSRRRPLRRPRFCEMGIDVETGVRERPRVGDSHTSRSSRISRAIHSERSCSRLRKLTAWVIGEQNPWRPGGRRANPLREGLNCTARALTDPGGVDKQSVAVAAVASSSCHSALERNVWRRSRSDRARRPRSPRPRTFGPSTRAGPAGSRDSCYALTCALQPFCSKGLWGFAGTLTVGPVL